MKCFYHSADMDGHCSGAIIKLMHPECEMIGINYGEDFPWNSVNQDEYVFMVDFSLENSEDMERLNNLSTLHWIDHHKTAIERAHNDGFIARGLQILDNDKAACELCYEYTGTKFPSKAVHLLGRYDIWQHEPGTFELQQGIRLQDTEPTEENMRFWKLLLQDEVLVDELVAKGEIIMQKQKNDNAIFAQYFAFELVFDDLRCICLNKGMSNSAVFDSVFDPNKHDAMLLFVHTGKHWKVSLYSDKDVPDVSNVAKVYGGGGHNNACGFQCETLPFKLPNVPY